MQYLHPSMNPAATIAGKHWRIGILSDALLRIEWSDTGAFEDNATLLAINRDFGYVPEYTAVEQHGLLVVETESLRLTYDMKPFSKEGLSIVVKGVKNTKTNTWHYGDTQDGNLHGTARTLDWADGEIPLENGVVSRDGWAVLDDSSTNIIAENNMINEESNPMETWILPRDHAETDIYFFGHGHRYAEAVKDFYRLTGPTPLLPKYALGNWWSRFHRYTADEYLQLLDRFEAEHLPFTTAVIDMDWHLVDDVDPKYGSGWTGYTWNRKLFPDPAAFLEQVHQRGYKVTLNVHPRDGIRAFEDGYKDAAHSMGIDPQTEDPVEFDPTDPRFMRTYFDLHHKLEADGVDFWWLDWQQGGVTRQRGLDPLWALNHMHYEDSKHDSRWPMTFSRYAGPGSHRYPVGFSGDTIVTWDSLRFQPMFTACASNIGYGWWSHDIGGHMFGYRDEELEARWYQLGVFSPINRLHSTDSPFNGKEPWNFQPQIRSAMNDALRLRHALIPYLHTMNWRASQEGEPLVEPMYWTAPENDEAYTVPNEFMFGTELLVSPITNPADKESHLSSADVWFPQGEWFDFFDGRRYVAKSDSGRRLAVWRGIDRTPVFAKAGAIIPMQDDATAIGDALNSIDNPRSLAIIVFPGVDGAYTLVEDDGTNPAAPEAARTHMSLVWGTEGARFAIEAAHGDTDAIPSHRTWNVQLRGIKQCDATVTVNDEQVSASSHYDPATLSMAVSIAEAPTNATVIIDFEGASIAANPYIEDSYEVLHHANMRYLTKEKAYAAIREDGALALPALNSLEHTSGPDMEDCSDSHMPDSVMKALEEVLLRS